MSLLALRAGIVPLAGPVTSARLKTTIAGISLPNPVGLAAGYDKNGVAIGPLSRAGFGFIEVGATTPRPQIGNERPRLFRLTADQAAINRFGFNNLGMEVMALRLARRPPGAVIGLNLGANKDSADRAADFAAVLARCGAMVDFATINISSPNTERLRDLQGKAALSALLDVVMVAQAQLPRRVPLFVKIAPDLEAGELSDIAGVALETGLAGIIATNTTLGREGLKSASSGEKGGLSGAPLFEKSTRVLAQLSLLTNGKLPLIGVGGVGSAEQAFEKICAGASAVQLYTAMIYQGLSLASDIARGLDRLLEQGGFASVSAAVSSGRNRWLN